MPINKGPMYGIPGRVGRAAAIGMVAALVVWMPAAAAEVTLVSALQQALAHNPALAAARLAEEAAQRDLRRAEAAYSFQLNLEGRPLGSEGRDSDTLKEYTAGRLRLGTSLNTMWGVGGSVALFHDYYKTSGQPSMGLTVSASAGLDPAALFYNPGRLDLAAKANAATKAVWDREELERQTAVNTLRSYWQLELDKERLALSREEAESKKTVYQQVVARQAGGAATPNDVLGALVDMRQAEATLHRAEVDYEARLTAFALDLGLPAEPGSLPALAPSGFVAGSDLTAEYRTDDLLKAAVQTSLAVKKKELDLAVAELRMTAARLGLLPSVTATYNYTFSDLSRLDEPNASKKNPWGVLVNVSLPLRDGGTRQLTVAGREAELAAAQKGVADARAAAERSMRQKLTTWELAREDVEIAGLRLDRARYEEAIKAEHYKMGVIPESSLTAAQQATRQAEINRQAAINAQLLAELDIALTAGDTLWLAGKPLVP